MNCARLSLYLLPPTLKQILSEKYNLKNVATAFQGVDVDRFRPKEGHAQSGGNDGLFDESNNGDDFLGGKLNGKFVVFSGGKMEMRKG